MKIRGNENVNERANDATGKKDSLSDQVTALSAGLSLRLTFLDIHWSNRLYFLNSKASMDSRLSDSTPRLQAETRPVEWVASLV